MVEGYGREKVFEGDLDSSILPSDSKMLLDNIKLKNNFRINGAIYGHNIEIRGKGFVNGPIMAREEIIIYPPTQEDEQILLSSGISSRKAISVKIPKKGKQTPVNDPKFAPLVIKGDVCSNIVHLENAIVLGNIHSDDAYLKDSIILGVPIIQNKLELTNTMVVTFDAKIVNLYKSNTLWLPYGIASERISFTEDSGENPQESGLVDDERQIHDIIYGFPSEVTCKVCESKYKIEHPIQFTCSKCETYIDIRGDGSVIMTLDISGSNDGLKEQPDDAHSSWLRYIGLCRSNHGCGEGHISCKDFNTKRCMYKDTRINEDDILHMKSYGETIKAATLATRLLDTREIERQVSAITEILQGMMLFEQFDERSKRKFVENARRKHEGPIVEKIVKLTHLFDSLEDSF